MTMAWKEIKDIERALDEGRVKDAIKQLMDGIEHADEIKDDFTLARMFLLLGKAYVRGGALESAAHPYRKALEMYRKMGDATGIAESLIGLGAVHRWRNDLEMAEELFEEYLEHVRESGSQTDVGRAHIEIGIVKSEKGDDKAAIAMFNEAVSALKNTDDRYQLSRAYASMGETYKRMEDYEKAVFNFLLGLECAVEMDLKRNMAYIGASVAECLARTGDLTRARNHVDRSIELFNASGDVIGLSDALRVDGMLWRMGGDLEKAKISLERSMDLVRDKDIPSNEVLVRFELIELDIASGKFAEAEAQTAKALEMAKGLGRPRIEDAAYKLMNTLKKAQAAK